MPRGAPNHSPMIAPIRAAGQDRRSPLTIAGTADGKLRRKKRFNRLDPEGGEQIFVGLRCAGEAGVHGNVDDEEHMDRSDPGGGRFAADQDQEDRPERDRGDRVDDRGEAVRTAL